ncbi:thiamine phosphate synthase [Benzoatithermus flavus]|uniref:Thiamine phosphate synthase n=1 Tax=Benzoatithermus flavus TaxID=3108223 RepID=A0ABU8XT28_9PROT
MPGLLLFVPLGPDGLAPELEVLLAEGGIAAVVGDVTALPTAARGPALAAAREACHRRATAFFVRNDATAAHAAAADGVHLDDPAKVAAVRSQLGPDAIIGAACGRSRHTAMVAGEAGADYVMLGTLDRPVEDEDGLSELVAWWNELFVIPCAVAGRLTPDRAAAFVRAGADLVAVTAGGNDLPELARTVRAIGPRPASSAMQG